MRASNCAHIQRAPCTGRVAPETLRTGFGGGALLPAVSFQPACTVTCDRHGEFGASTPK